MPDASLAFDHVHVISPDPQSTANWYVEKLGGKILKSVTGRGTTQIAVGLGGAMVLVRGQREEEPAVANKSGLEWGIDHFGMRVQGDFDGFCAGLKQQGVTFIVEPKDVNPTTRIAFINAPDGVSIELLNRK